MELNQHIANLQNLQALENEVTGLMLVVGGELLAKIKNRITVDGKNSNGGNIGRYSTRAMWVTLDMFDKTSAFKPEAKSGGEVITYDYQTKKKSRTNVTKDFRQPKTMYLPRGYFQLREMQGKPVHIVNLVYRGDMILSYQMAREGNSVVIGFISQRESMKRKQMEKKFAAPIFSGSRSELDEASQLFLKKYNEVTLKILNG